MNKIITFFKESYTELTEKVTWPNSKALLSSSVTVLVASVLISLLIALMDFSFGSNNNSEVWKGLLGLYYNTFK